MADGVRYVRNVVGSSTMRIAVNMVTGLIFGLGLAYLWYGQSGHKVQSFLDVAGTFDPSLICVMLGPSPVVANLRFGYRFAFRRPRTGSGRAVLASNSEGCSMGEWWSSAALFGIGWGLSGFCPAQAITSFLLLAKGTLIFVPAMLVGISLARLLIQTSPSGKAVSAGTTEA